MKEIDIKQLKEMLESASNNLSNNKDLVNDLNVFPVPDGDTGTNMNMTIQSALKEAKKTDPNNIDIKLFLKNFSKGSLLGARGNSGVILSQLIRGFTDSIPDGALTLNSQDFSNGLEKSSEVAYNAVMKPTEGTILTVAKDVARAAKSFNKKNVSLTKFFNHCISEGNKSLNRTPDLLPALKEAGVVDAGGKGYMCLIEGCARYLSDSPVLIDEVPEGYTKPIEKDYTYTVKLNIASELNLKKQMEIEHLISIDGPKPEINIKKEFSTLTSNTENPAKIIETAMKYGEIFDIDIKNNTHKPKEEVFEKQNKHYENAFIVVSSGEGFNEVFKSLNVTTIIHGGQTMNPSTEDFYSAINELDAENIFILPNNSNIILAAEQAQSLSDKNVYVIPSKNIPQGIAAMISYVEGNSAEDIFETATNAMSLVNSGEVTYAVRESSVNGNTINEGEIIGVSKKDIVAKGEDLNTVALDLIKKLYNEDSFIISIYYGSDVEEDTAQDLKEMAENEFEEADVELVYGGQPLYYYVISLE